jgi:molecular chaperone DnaK
LERLLAVAEQVKIQLSENNRASVKVEEVLPDHPVDFEFSIAASDLRPHIEPVLRRTIPVCEEALDSAGLRAGQIDEIVLVGGTTRLPQVTEIVKEVFGKAPQTSINPMSVVAVGAAIQGAALVGSLVPLADTSDKGASSTGTAVLLDVVPRSLGVRTAGGFVDFIIERNSAIPIEQTRLFVTAKDNQQYVRIQVCQGEEETFDKNHKLGEVVLGNLRPAQRGEVQIAVTFEINTDGLLEVRAVDQSTGQRQVATMRVLGGVTDEELERLFEKDERPASDDGEIRSVP